MTAIDPVCKTKVEEKEARYTSVHGGRTYYFCNQGCKRTFDSDPEKCTR
jgi:YHS domain-containing protein